MIGVSPAAFAFAERFSNCGLGLRHADARLPELRLVVVPAHEVVGLSGTVGLSAERRAVLLVPRLLDSSVGLMPLNHLYCFAYFSVGMMSPRLHELRVARVVRGADQDVGCAAALQGELGGSDPLRRTA